jgi:hypothetical protein
VRLPAGRLTTLVRGSSLYPSLGKEGDVMARCFVIQPFDRGGPFDKRYRDVLAPAINDAGLEHYRVDEDPGTTVLIDAIEAGIRDSEICLADITNDNPNIWYEVGYAIASGKPIVMVCANPRPTGPPFDIRHRQVIFYSPDSPSDFKKMGDEITARLKAQLQKTEELRTIASLSPVKKTEGLSSYEIATLVSLMENRLEPDAGITPHAIQQSMRKAGYTDIAIGLSLESLTKKGMIEFDESEPNDFGNTYTICKLTGPGLDWLLANQDRFLLSRRKSAPLSDEDIPF